MSKNTCFNCGYEDNGKTFDKVVFSCLDCGKPLCVDCYLGSDCINGVSDQFVCYCKTCLKDDSEGEFCDAT